MAQEHGQILIQFESADGSRQHVPLKADTHRAGYDAIADATDRRQEMPLAFKHGGVGCGENGYVRVLFDADASDVVESEESSLRLDVTLINNKTGAMQPTTLTFENMTGFTSGGTVDVTHLASQIVQLAYYQVPAGNTLVLGHPIDGRFYCFLGDDT